MKTSSSLLFPWRALCAVLLTAALAVTAQEPPAAPAPGNPPAAQKKSEQPEPELRRIDNPATPPEATAPETTTTPSTSTSTTQRTSRRVRSGNGGQFPFGDHHVPLGSHMREAVSIFGSTWVEGDVDSDVVSVIGDTRIGPEAKIGGATVAVLGRLDVEGRVRGEAVGVLGGVKINGHVSGEVVSVLGGLELGPKAVIDGDVVVVGGRMKKDPAAVVNGNVVNVPIFGGFGDLDWLVTWFKRCLLLGRPLAFGQHLGWAWAIAFSFLGLYLLLALLFRRGLENCTLTLETRPGYSVLASVLTVFLTPVAIVLLAVTVLGAVLVPFVGIGLLCAGLFGKAVMLAWIGRRFTRFFGDGPLGHPVFAVLVGGILVMLLYTVPFFGYLLYKLLSWLGLGVVIYTLVLRMRAERAAAAAASAAAAANAAATSGIASVAVPPVATTPAGASTVANFMATDSPSISEPPVARVASGIAAPAVSSGFTGSDPTTAGPIPASVPPPPPAAPLPPPMPPRAFARVPVMPALAAVTLPRATFMIRMAALLLDLVLVGLLTAFFVNLVPRGLRMEPPSFLLFLAAYGAIMWKLRGTTIGGIVCGLKVVRLDDRPLDWPTAVVRALSCFLSLVVAGLGFIWIAIDDEKQSWHDKIAGTVVVRVPKGVSLL